MLDGVIVMLRLKDKMKLGAKARPHRPFLRGERNKLRNAFFAKPALEGSGPQSQNKDEALLVLTKYLADIVLFCTMK